MSEIDSKYCIICGKLIDEKRILQGKTTCCRSCANSLASKKQWADKDKRLKLLEGIKHNAQSEESKNKKREIMLNKWQSQEFKNKVHSTNSSKETFLKRSNASKIKWADKTYKERTSFAIRKAYQNKEVREHLSEAMKKALSSEEARKRISESLKRRFSDVGERKKLSEALKRTYSDSRVRLKVSDSVRNAFKREEVRKNHSDAMKKLYLERKDEITKKITETKRKNHSFGTSREELAVLDYLKSKFVNVIHQYRSKEYPFNCDFYLKDFDIYIEYHGDWTHGGRPWDKNDNDCTKLLEKWMEHVDSSKYYRTAVYVWTELDVRKRKIANDNNLSYFTFYNFDQVKNWYENSIFNKENTKC